MRQRHQLGDYCGSPWKRWGFHQESEQIQKRQNILRKHLGNKVGRNYSLLRGWERRLLSVFAAEISNRKRIQDKEQMLKIDFSFEHIAFERPAGCTVKIACRQLIECSLGVNNSKIIGKTMKIDELTQREHIEWQARETNREKKSLGTPAFMGALKEEYPVKEIIKTTAGRWKDTQRTLVPYKPKESRISRRKWAVLWNVAESLSEGRIEKCPMHLAVRIPLVTIIRIII